MTHDAPDLRDDDVLKVVDLHCSLGSGKKRTRVLRGVDLTIRSGSILGILGANGAGKTTLVNVLSTLIPFQEGHVTVAGYDLKKEPAKVRQSISLTGQYAAVDELLTGRENLVYFGQLSRLTKKESAQRADEMLELFSLSGAADRRVSEYSGGMRRRLDIAVSLMVPPKLLFLDEPTTGLDPSSRADVWEMIQQLRQIGTSVLLTTQYLEEADRLSDRIAVLAQGRVVAEGTPRDLKERYGNMFCDVTMNTTAHAEEFNTLATDQGMNTQLDDCVIRAEAPQGHRDLVRLLNLWTGDPDDIIDVSLTPPSLEDVYRALADSGDIAGKAGH